LGVLIEELTDAVPLELQAAFRLAWERIGLSLEAAGLAADPVLRVSLPKVLVASPFVIERCARDADILASLAGSGRLQASLQPNELVETLSSRLSGDLDEAQCKALLRRFRNAEMVRIAWRDIAGWAPLEETLGDLTVLAEACIQVGLEWLFERACALRGTPLNGHGGPQRMTVLGMGKLGAWELNFSSDIDLIFAYEREGVLSDRRETSYGEFYTRLAQSLVKLLDEPTVDGFVFRVDTRLRPFGDSGPLVMSFDAMEHYYQTQAREWERYAMVKARVVAGDPGAGQRLEKILHPFVYRRYLDYRAFGELRELKQKITLELKRKDRQDNVKLGPGGIREVEFIGQAFQLIRGGREKSLQERSILKVLKALGSAGHLPVAVVSKLAAAYRFLRLVENRIQQYEDRQTHDLPTQALVRASLAFALGFADWEAFIAQLDDVRTGVHEVFEQVFESPHVAQGTDSPVNWLDLDESLLERMLVELGLPADSGLAPALREFALCAAVKRMTPKGVVELNRLLPLLLRMLRPTADPRTALVRILKLLETIASRNVYLTLLVENPLALSQLVKLAAASNWIVAYIAAHPLLLDELLDPARLYAPLSRDKLKAELAQRLGNVDADDDEQFMLALRQFKQQNVLRIAVADVMGIIPIMVVSDYLTFLAETIVAGVVEQAWQLTAQRHGVPPGHAGDRAVRGFAVIGYGKMGGLELSYASDLDLVFLYGGVQDTVMTDGSSPIPAAQFFARVGKRIINILTTRMLGGELYEIDLRLRPSGNSGLLVSSLEAYESYQLNDAWTWELQALTRARFVAGDPEIGAAFEAIRARALGRPRDLVVLRDEVRNMREKMRENLAVKVPGVFDLKQGPGGIADIEFIVQFKVLSGAHDYSQLLRWTDVVRSLDTLSECACLDAADAQALRAAYIAYRESTHRAALLEEPAVVPESEYTDLRDRVLAIWDALFAPTENPKPGEN